MSDKTVNMPIPVRISKWGYKPGMKGSMLGWSIGDRASIKSTKPNHPDDGKMVTIKSDMVAHAAVPGVPCREVLFDGEAALSCIKEDVLVPVFTDDEQSIRKQEGWA